MEEEEPLGLRAIPEEGEGEDFPFSPPNAGELKKQEEAKKDSFAPKLPTAVLEESEGASGPQQAPKPAIPPKATEKTSASQPSKPNQPAAPPKPEAPAKPATPQASPSVAGNCPM